jgi:NAD(P)-dependent dehydrogenase (short-subunit alcohol dehydrogenase family)
MDYTSTKGALVSFTRALSNQILTEKQIRVNAIW